MIDKPGVYLLSDATYFADPCPVPSLNRSIGKVLLSRSPRHAWWQHPRLNPDWQPDDDSEFDFGKAAHDVLLRGGEFVEVIDAADYRKKATKEARDNALAAGRLPILASKYAHIEAMVKAAREQLAAHEEAADAFSDGQPEVTLAWQEGETWCRCRLDWMPRGKGRAFYDFKTTGNASPDAWSERVCFETGADVQAVFSARALKALKLATAPIFRFVVQETEPPYALSVNQITPAALDMAQRKVDAMIELWRWCLAENRWPGYPAQVCHAEPPPWQERRWIEREGREEIARINGEDLKRRLLDWYAPITPAA